MSKKPTKKLKAAEFKNGRRYLRDKVKTAFMESEHMYVKEFIQDLFGKYTGTMRKNTKGRSDQKADMIRQAQGQAMNEVQKDLVDQYKIPTFELMQMKMSTLNLVKVFLNGALVKEIDPETKKEKFVLQRSMRDIKRAYEMIKIELGEPTTISDFNPEEGLGHMIISFGGGGKNSVGPSQFIQPEK